MPGLNVPQTPNPPEGMDVPIVPDTNVRRGTNVSYTRSAYYDPYSAKGETLRFINDTNLRQQWR